MEPTEIEPLVDGLAGIIDRALNGETRPKTIGFVLVVFPFTPGLTKALCASNGDEESSIYAIREFIRCWDSCKALEQATPGQTH